jgi:putative RecB family exonuclease
MSLPLPGTLTPSKISSYTSCPLAFRFAVIDGLPERPSSAAAVGTLVHRGLQFLFSAHEAGERDRFAAHMAVSAAFDEPAGRRLLAGLGVDEAGEAVLRTRAERLMERYFELEEPDGVHAIGLELEMRAELGEIHAHGIIDRLDLLPSGELAVVDYKTGRSPSPQRLCSRLGGVQFYAFLCEQVLGVRPSLVRLLYLRDRVAITAVPTDQAMRGFRQRAEAVWKAIACACERDDFRPCPSRLCRSCGFRDRCPAFGGKPDDVRRHAGHATAPLRHPSPAGVPAPRPPSVPAVA